MQLLWQKRAVTLPEALARLPLTTSLVGRGMAAAVEAAPLGPELPLDQARGPQKWRLQRRRLFWSRGRLKLRLPPLPLPHL